MAKEKLTRAQNEALRILTDLNEKLTLLEKWLQKNEISQELYNSYTNKLMNRAMKDVRPSCDTENDEYCGLAIESEMQRFLGNLRAKLNLYLSNRSIDKAKLSEDEMFMFKAFINHYPQLKSKINRLLVVGLRYPDKRLNKICEEYILKYRIIQAINYADTAFWIMLWEDGNFVPRNAIRLMVVKDGERFKLNSCFRPELIRELIPLVEFQRDKELKRLNWVKTLSDAQKRETEVTRKQKRLDSFNCLLKLLSEALN